MSIELNIFQRFAPDFEKLIKFGFSEFNNQYVYETTFFNNQFKAVIEVSKNCEIKGTVYDLENEDEFLPLRVENPQGGFAEEVKTKYEELLTDIRTQCFNKNYFILPQSNRITNLIIEKYGSSPEFLWEKLSGCGVFRNKDSNKWFGIIMDINRGKITGNNTKKEEIVDVLNVKLFEEHVQELIMQPDFYPAYHMNKKSWISIILDESVSDKKIMQLIEESYQLSHKKIKKVK